MQLRQKRLKAARTILGIAIGKAPKPKLFKFYIDLETQLAQRDRLRILYGKFVEWDSTNSMAWILFADLESSLEVWHSGRAMIGACPA
jgi:crooked neck